jgi:hypothetical protein
MTIQRELEILHGLRDTYTCLCSYSGGKNEEAAVALEAVRERIATVELNALHEAEKLR